MKKGNVIGNRFVTKQFIEDDGEIVKYHIQVYYGCNQCNSQGFTYNTDSGRKRSCTWCNKTGYHIATLEKKCGLQWTEIKLASMKEDDRSLIRDKFNSKNTKFDYDGRPYYCTIKVKKCHCEGNKYEYDRYTGEKKLRNCSLCGGRNKVAEVTRFESFRRKDSWDYSHRKVTTTEKIPPDHKESECFITTATLKYVDIENEDRILDQFRVFRDNYVFENYFPQIQEYYHKSPLILEVINEKEDYEIFKLIWSNYLEKAYNQIKEENYLQSYKIYCECMTFLSNRYLNHYKGDWQ